ncbi:MAG: hypothetical protein ABIJ39_03440 [Chloroflexota bacterium]
MTRETAFYFSSISKWAALPKPAERTDGRAPGDHNGRAIGDYLLWKAFLKTIQRFRGQSFRDQM